MKTVAIRTKEQGGLCGHIVFYDVTNQVYWAYCTGDIVKYQIPLDEFFAKVFDAAADFVGEEGLRKAITVAQNRRNLDKAS